MPPRVETVEGIALCVYFGDHNPPHFHARAAGREARIVIDTLAILTNDLPGGQLATVLAWAAAPGRQDLLRAAWAKCNP
jgi:hypothetical protein